MEDVILCYDGTVRNSLGDLVQFIYGEDGMDGAFIERQNIDTFGLNHKEFEHNYRVDVTDPSGGFLQVHRVLSGSCAVAGCLPLKWPVAPVRDANTPHGLECEW